MGKLDTFKFGREEKIENSFLIADNTIPLFTIQPAVIFNETEWVFQFDEGEPTVFAVQQEEPNLTITLNNSNHASIEFTGPNNQKFKIFARERQQ
jgi:hypothetical protein